MTHREALEHAREILNFAQLKSPPDPKNFLEYGALVAYAAKSLNTRSRQTIPWLNDWAVAWRKLCDDFNKIVEADPMILYRPANKAAEEFHSSDAYVRYFRAGNRTSKTQSGYAEHYLVTTGQHKWRPFNSPPNSTFIIAGLPFTTYAPGVFEKKFLTGEDANSLSPMFPVGGKWLNHYDERRYCITIACPGCAELGKAGSCSHPKSTIKLFSNENGWEVLQGQAYLLGHFDEHVDEDFYNEARQRTKTVPGGCLIVTGTPLHGEEAWEQLRLAQLVQDPGANHTDPADKNSPPFVSLHQISMYDAGLVPHAAIRAEEQQMDEFERKARIYGEPAPLAKNPVFDRVALQEIKAAYARPPTFYHLDLPPGVALATCDPATPILAAPHPSTLLRVWELPTTDGLYIAAVDTALGLSQDPRRGDNSCCSVLKVFQLGAGVGLELVAQFHGKLTLYDYADEIMKLAIWYNSARVIVELTGGYGHAVVMRLKEHAYWNLYRPPTDRAAVGSRLGEKLGVDTSALSKPFMVSALQHLIKNRAFKIPCTATIQELVAFTQEITGHNNSALVTPRYRGAGGTHDDRVMSLAIGASVAISDPQLAYQVQFKTEKETWGVQKQVSPEMEAIYKELHEERASYVNLV